MLHAPDQAETIIAEGLAKVADVAKSLSAVTAYLVFFETSNIIYKM